MRREIYIPSVFLMNRPRVCVSRWHGEEIGGHLFATLKKLPWRIIGIIILHLIFPEHETRAYTDIVALEVNRTTGRDGIQHAFRGRDPQPEQRCAAEQPAW